MKFTDKEAQGIVDHSRRKQILLDAEEALRQKKIEIAEAKMQRAKAKVEAEETSAKKEGRC